MTDHAPYTHRHPRRVISLRTRTRLLGTLNLALALRGDSCGWGTCDRPRRTFVGRNRVNPGGGQHFIELLLYGSAFQPVWSKRFNLDRTNA